ncbi:protein of unknown function [Paraburkholderia kururiensis]
MCGTLRTSFSASSLRSASRTEVRLTPSVSHNSRSINRAPGAKRPLMIAWRSTFSTWCRNVSGRTNSISVDIIVFPSDKNPVAMILHSNLILWRDDDRAGQSDVCG